MNSQQQLNKADGREGKREKEEKARRKKSG